MTQADVDNVKNAALSILGFYNSPQQWVGLVTLPYGQTGNKCIAYGNSRETRPPISYPDSNYTDWQVVPLSTDYTIADGTLNTSEPIVQQINCLLRAPTVRSTVERAATEREPHEPR